MSALPSPAPGTANHRTLPLGRQLLACGAISSDQLRIALIEQRRDDMPLGRLLVKLGFISEATLRDALGNALGHTPVDLGGSIADAEALGRVPRELAARHRLLPLAYHADTRHLTIAVADPTDIVAIDRLRAHLPANTHIETRLAGEHDIVRAIDRHYGYELSIDGILDEIETGTPAPHGMAPGEGEYSQPLVRLIDALLADAYKNEASDIHFEPEAHFLRIRYRIDGCLQQVRALRKSYWSGMAVRLKVMSGMNIAETRAPQDGRFTLAVGGHPVDFRAATLPTLHGENLVLRLLDRARGLVALDAIGFDTGQLDLVKRMIARPEGLLLVTGPTGSGKTTTLYSLLGHIADAGINIMTLEDPVEYPLPLVRQTSLGDAVKLDFADGIRSIMRQDPDVILVGEIRDAATATMALRAAMTGHQVYSTLHSNSALGAIARLVDIGIPAELLAGNLIGIVAQRLLRRLCPHCRIAAPANAAEMRLLGLDGERAAPTLYRPGGCPQCRQQGYRGRIAIMEVLRFDAELDGLVAAGASTASLRQAAGARGLRTLADDGARRVLDGTTALAELARCVDLTERM